MAITETKATEQRFATTQEVPFVGQGCIFLQNAQKVARKQQANFFCISTRIVRTIHNKPHTTKEEHRDAQSSIRITPHTTLPGKASFFPQITQLLTDSFETIRHATPSTLAREICVRRRTAKGIEDLYENGFVEPQTTPRVPAYYRAGQRLLRCDDRWSALHPPTECLTMTIEVRYTREQTQEKQRR